MPTTVGWDTLINAATAKLLAKVNQKCYEIAWDLFTNVVKFTPSPTSNPSGVVTKGLLANQWYPQEGSVSGSVGSTTSPNGSSSLERIKALQGTAFYGKDGRLTMANNLDYAYRAEAIGWPSPQWSGKSGGDRAGGPYRMVARSLQATLAKYRKVKI